MSGVNWEHQGDEVIAKELLLMAMEKEYLDPRSADFAEKAKNLGAAFKAVLNEITKE